MRAVIVEEPREDYILEMRFWEGWFQTWAGTSELAYALIEAPTGHVLRVAADNFRFCHPGKEY